MNIDDFGEIMDKVLLDNKVQLVLEMPEGTLDAEIKDNLGLGPTVQLYILLNAIRTVAAEVEKLAGPFDEDKLANALADLVRQDIRECIKAGAEAAP